jgi:hypothetical protein
MTSPSASPPPRSGSALVLLPLLAFLVLLVGGVLLFFEHRSRQQQGARILALEEQVARLQGRLERLAQEQSTRSLPAPPPVRPTQPARPAARPTALLVEQHPHVLMTEATMGIYVVSLGSEHGARLGQRMRILRDGVYVTEIVLDTVEPTASAGTIPEDAPRVEVRKGDDVQPVDP